MPPGVRRSSSTRSLEWFTWRVRSHCCFRKRGTEYVREYDVQWMSGSTERQCDRALDSPRRSSAATPAARPRPAAQPAHPPLARPPLNTRRHPPKILQGLPKLWVNFKALTKIFSQSVGPLGQPLGQPCAIFVPQHSAPARRRAGRGGTSTRSPVEPCCSTLMTHAPRSARIRVACVATPPAGSARRPHRSPA
jgi:hypothetical protein